MGFGKKKGISAVAVILVFAIFSTAAFLLPLERTLTFWLGYSFEGIAAGLMLVSLLFLFDAAYKEKTFLRLPIVSLAWGYFVLQTGISAWEITGFSAPYLPSLIINACLAAFFVVALLASSAAGEAIETQERQVAHKTFFLKNLQGILLSVKTEDADLQKKLKKLCDDVRFSDPMSHSMLGELEQQIEAKAVMLKSEIQNREKATESMECISELLKERNQKCRLYKSVKEDKPSKDNSGVRYVAITVGALGAVVTIALIVCSVILPNNIYKTGISLYEAEKYEEAIDVFEGLDGFGDSKNMVVACEEGIKNNQYKAALELFKDEKYDDAILAFESLGNYKDSKEMIVSVKEKRTEEKYELAESHMNSQNYVEAIKLYKELGEYRDSKQKIEKINNRLATDDVLYYGSYQGNPIAWQAVKTENDRMLLIAKNSVCDLPFNDEIKNVKWTESSLRKWLNNDFMSAFSEEQLSSIIAQNIDGADCKVFLPGKEDLEKIENKALLASDKDWWLRTKAETETNAMFVTQNGRLTEEGDTVVRAKGVRPCIWIEL